MKENKKPNNINTKYLSRCVKTLERSHNYMLKQNPEDIDYDIFRAACIKEFEIVLEQCGKLLKKRIRDFFHSNKAVDRLVFRDIFRYSAKHGLISLPACERWMKYRDNRNDTAHDYGEGFAEQTLKVLPEFIADVKDIINVLDKTNSQTE